MKLQSVACVAVAGLATALAGCGPTSDTSKSAANAPPAALSSDMAPAPDSAAKPAPGAPDASVSQVPGSPAAKADATGVDDATISSEVEAAIKAEPALESQPITVATADATVTLSGSVSNESLSSRAQRIAMATPGVKNVVNNLSVQAS